MSFYLRVTSSVSWINRFFIDQSLVDLVASKHEEFGAGTCSSVPARQRPQARLGTSRRCQARALTPDARQDVSISLGQSAHSPKLPNSRSAQLGQNTATPAGSSSSESEAS